MTVKNNEVDAVNACHKLRAAFSAGHVDTVQLALEEMLPNPSKECIAYVHGCWNGNVMHMDAAARRGTPVLRFNHDLNQWDCKRLHKEGA